MNRHWLLIGSSGTCIALSVKPAGVAPGVGLQLLTGAKSKPSGVTKMIRRRGGSPPAARAPGSFGFRSALLHEIAYGWSII